MQLRPSRKKKVSVTFMIVFMILFSAATLALKWVFAPLYQVNGASTWVDEEKALNTESRLDSLFGPADEDGYRVTELLYDSSRDFELMKVKDSVETSSFTYQMCFRTLDNDGVIKNVPPEVVEFRVTEDESKVFTAKVRFIWDNTDSIDSIILYVPPNFSIVSVDELSNFDYNYTLPDKEPD